MNNPACRRSAAALLAATALLAPAVPAAADEGGSGGEGTASAAVLRAGLDVSLLNDGVRLPLAASLNEVTAPAGGGSADETLLTATLDGVDEGRPFEMLSAEVASATATTDAGGATAEASLANARVHLPGLPLLSLIELDAVSARATCVPGEEPTAETVMPAAITALGQEVDLTSAGTTTLTAPGVGEVVLELSSQETGDGTAAATALELSVSVNPLDLNVAEVTGTVTLASASCGTPAGGADEEAPAGTRPQTSGEEPDLAETGGGSSTPYVVGGGLGLLMAGAAAVLVARRRAAASGRG
ncbi:SCO1860 family LAETG-anchored protein [Streptomyces litchfieldiae]|uniref:SCO1860 family LAETG-anchored protein n=1 Tax=Streptomyces litchfieldiae TaxID=3075543 RepID=A0ABU2MU54_9ACTN|nr:SCO1860 family LAETG-anchored protein [Streptomyces sp. DSM 44938]MDT0344848.1 SCO1860 family LAETG-anchored protein [Streptomyces sp. DSM 44938]